MTNDEINRLVAEARGWTDIHPDHEGILVGIQPGSIHEFWVPDVCADPAAWGALLVELADYSPGIHRQKDRWQGSLIVGSKAYWDHADTPGRALALAYLKAQGRLP